MKSKLEIAVAAMQPCPMCGTTPIEDGKSDYLRIRCEDCGMQGPSFHFDGDDDDDIERASGEAAAHWNRRAGDAKDAARYRWLRDSTDSGRCIRGLYEDGQSIPSAVDEMIDAAIRAQGSDAA